MADSASLLELVWTGIAVVALGFTAYIIDDNVRNYRAIRQAVREGWATAWGPRWWVAFASLVSSVAMFVVWLGFASIGVVSMTVSPHDPPESRATVSQVTGVVLVCMTLLLAGIQAWQVYARTHIRPLMQPTNTDIHAVSKQAHRTASMVDALQPNESSQEPRA
jgi:hypothetical protein